MKFEDEFVSPGLDKRMKELGFKQNGAYKRCGGHIDYHDDDNGIFEDCDNTDILDDDEYCHTAGLTCEFTISAYSVAELGEMLPYKIIEEDGDWLGDLEICKLKNNTWHISYHKAGFNVLHDLIEKTEADARAKMLIYLAEQGLIKNKL